MSNKAQVGSGIIGLFIAVVVLFTLLSALFPVVEDSAIDATDAMNGTSGSANYSASIAELPGTAWLLIILGIIFGIIAFATRGL